MQTQNIISAREKKANTTRPTLWKWMDSCLSDVIYLRWFYSVLRLIFGRIRRLLGGVFVVIVVVVGLMCCSCWYFVWTVVGDGCVNADRWYASVVWCALVCSEYDFVCEKKERMLYMCFRVLLMLGNDRAHCRMHLTSEDMRLCALTRFRIWWIWSLLMLCNVKWCDVVWYVTSSWLEVRLNY